MDRGAGGCAAPSPRPVWPEPCCRFCLSTTCPRPTPTLESGTIPADPTRSFQNEGVGRDGDEAALVALHPARGDWRSCPRPRRPGGNRPACGVTVPSRAGAALRGPGESAVHGRGLPSHQETQLTLKEVQLWASVCGFHWPNQPPNLLDRAGLVEERKCQEQSHSWSH